MAVHGHDTSRSDRYLSSVAAADLVNPNGVCGARSYKSCTKCTLLLGNWLKVNQVLLLLNSRLPENDTYMIQVRLTAARQLLQCCGCHATLPSVVLQRPVA